MALRVNGDCTACDACKPVCPADCIVQRADFVEMPAGLRAKYESLHG